MSYKLKNAFSEIGNSLDLASVGWPQLISQSTQNDVVIWFIRNF